MDYLHELLPECAEEETLRLTIPQGSLLPEGHYVLLESYCTNPECNCGEVVLQVERQPIDNKSECQHSSPPMGVLVYSWNKPISEANPSVYPYLPRSEWTQATQQYMRSYFEKNEDYIEKLRKHYELIREEASRLSKLYSPQNPIRKKIHIGRNDPCFCGSGKKFKKCCSKKIVD